MKKILIILFRLLASTVSTYFYSGVECDIAVSEPTWEDGWRDFIPAPVQVESKGNPNALGKNNDRGILQITPILVKEVNRISGLAYTHDDAWNPEKSIEMFYIITRKYCPEHDFEKMARIWNGGPHGHTKDYTIAYWNKVKNELDRNI